jgi:hypothetical protein
VAAKRGFKLRDRRHHEVKLRVWIGEFALQIQKICARNMRGLEGVPSGHGDIGNAAAFGLIFKIGRTIEQPEIGLIEDAGEFRSRDEPVALRHVFRLPADFSVRWYGERSWKDSRRWRACPLIAGFQSDIAVRDSAAGFYNRRSQLAR